jgi:hypothetical protein
MYGQIDQQLFKKAGKENIVTAVAKVAAAIA